MTDATPPASWVDLIRALPESVMEAFAHQFGRDIHIEMKLKYDATGRPGPVFTFVMARPGLLPTDIERAWFSAYVLAYRHCCNRVLDMLDAATNEKVPS